LFPQFNGFNLFFDRPPVIFAIQSKPKTMKTTMIIFLFVLSAFSYVSYAGDPVKVRTLSGASNPQWEVFSYKHMETMNHYIHTGNMLLLDGIRTGTRFLTAWSAEIFTFRWIPGMDQTHRYLRHCCGFLSFGWIIQPIFSY